MILTQLKMVNALKIDDLKSFLDFKSQYYNSPEFIKQDPIQIPKLYTRKEDIETIKQLNLKIEQQQKRVLSTEENMDKLKYELMNREKNFNQLFGRKPNVGVMNINGSKNKENKHRCK